MIKKLSEPMKALLISSTPGERVAHGPIRAALMRRGLVHRLDTGSQSAGMLTPAGEAAREFLIGSPGGLVTMIGKLPEK